LEGDYKITTAAHHVVPEKVGENIRPLRETKDKNRAKMLKKHERRQSFYKPVRGGKNTFHKEERDCRGGKQGHLNVVAKHGGERESGGRDTYWRRGRGKMEEKFSPSQGLHSKRRPVTSAGKKASGMNNKNNADPSLTKRK